MVWGPVIREFTQGKVTCFPSDSVKIMDAKPHVHVLPPLETLLVCVFGLIHFIQRLLYDDRQPLQLREPLPPWLRTLLRNFGADLLKLVRLSVLLWLPPMRG